MSDGDWMDGDLTPDPDDAYMCKRDQEDFDTALAELGLTAEEFAAALTLQPVQDGAVPSCLMVAPSMRHGFGLFATEEMEKGQRIQVRVRGEITPAGLYVNHAHDPNTIAVHYRDGEIELETITTVKRGQEITQNYRHAVWTEDEHMLRIPQGMVINPSKES